MVKVTYFGPAPAQPITTVGRGVLDALAKADWDAALRGLPGRAADIVDQVFAVVVQRRFAIAFDSDLVDLFAQSVQDSYSSIDAQQVATVIRFVLARGPRPNLNPHQLGNIVIDCLKHMMIDNAIVVDEAGDLVATAEARAMRVLRKKLATAPSVGRLFSARLRAFGSMVNEYDSHTQQVGVDPVPSSIIGQKLKAIAYFDFIRRDRMPSDDNDDGIVAVVNAVNSTMVRRMFPSVPSVEEVSHLATLVRMSFAAELDVARVLDAITCEITGSSAPADDQTDDDFRSKILLFAQIAHDLGLYGRELDSLLLQAEQVAASMGCVPTPARL